MEDRRERKVVVGAGKGGAIKTRLYV